MEVEWVRFWVLGPDGRTPRPATLGEWALMRNSPARFLWRDNVDGVAVITAFHGEDPDVMVGEERTPQRLFGTLAVTREWRMETLYATYEEAEAGHRLAVASLRA